MGVFRVEASPNNRAGCINAECKNAKVKITKGEFRYAIQVTIKDHQSWQYKHWGCVTPKQIQNLRDSSDGDTDLVDGYDELPPEFQEKIDFALEHGHVPDEDWKGDPGKNRPGQNGFRLNKKEAAQKAKEAAASDDDSADEKPKKKRARKSKAEKVDGSEHDSEPEAPPPKKKAGRPAKKDVADDEAAAPKKRGRPAKKEVDDDEAPPPKKARASRRMKVEYNEDDDDDDDEAPPLKKAGGKKTAVKEEKDDGDVDDGDETEETEAPKPKRGTKKAVSAKGEVKVPQKRGRKKATTDDE